MRLQTKNPNSVKTSGIQKTVSFGIKGQEGLAHIFSVLRNQLYSDKVLAVVREYTCNAVDANVEAGKSDLPIEVTLPNALNPTFKVRDFGPALSDKDIDEVYAFYGESTKRNSNNQIGQLGLGSKSAFAYGDNFVINSFIDGEKHSYNAFIDPTQIGQIAKLSVEPTKEPSGIEIVIPVREDDHTEFVEKAKILFKHFKVRPIIHGVEQFEYEDSELLFSGDNWEWYNVKHTGYGNHYGDAVAVMGNIAYPIDESALNLREDDTNLQHLLNDNLVLKLEIGTTVFEPHSSIRISLRTIGSDTS